MENQIYHGYAHGGPLHGKTITHTAPYYRAREKVEMPAFAPIGKPVNIDIPIVEYHYNNGKWILAL